MNSPDEYIEELLSAYLDGALTADETARAEQLLRSNAEYQKLLDEMRSLKGEIRALPTYQLPADFHQRVIAIAQPQLGEQRRLAPAAVASEAAQRWSWRRIAVVAGSLAAAIALAFIVLRNLPVDAPNGQGVVQQVPDESQNPDDRIGPTDDSKETSPDLIASDDEPPTKPRIDVVESPRSPETPAADTIVDVMPRTVTPETPADLTNIPNPLVSIPNRHLDAIWPEMKELVAAEPAAALEPDNGKLVFVVHVTLTPSGVRNQTFAQVLEGRGIWLDSSIPLNARLERSLLEGRFIAGTDEKERDNRKGVGLVYVEATALQIDFASRELASHRDDVKRVQYDYTRKPTELDVFRQLHDEAVQIGLDEVTMMPAQVVDRGGPRKSYLPRGSARPVVTSGMPGVADGFVGMFPEPVAAPEGDQFVPMMVDVVPLPEPEAVEPIVPVVPVNEHQVGRMNPIVHTLFVVRLAE